MTKTYLKVYLEPDLIRRLKRKSEEAGFEGRGQLTRFFELIATKDICFLDDNLKKLLRHIGNGA